MHPGEHSARAINGRCIPWNTRKKFFEKDIGKLKTTAKKNEKTTLSQDADADTRTLANAFASATMDWVQLHGDRVEQYWQWKSNLRPDLSREKLPGTE